MTEKKIIYKIKQVSQGKWWIEQYLRDVCSTRKDRFQKRYENSGTC